MVNVDAGDHPAAPAVHDCPTPGRIMQNREVKCPATTLTVVNVDAVGRPATRRAPSTMADAEQDRRKSRKPSRTFRPHICQRRWPPRRRRGGVGHGLNAMDSTKWTTPVGSPGHDPLAGAPDGTATARDALQ